MEANMRVVEGRGFDHEIVSTSVPGFYLLAKVFVDLDDAGQDRGLALARLFAASPDLLDACKSALDELHARFGLTDDELGVECRLLNAIEKAKS
jgi:hypothetical protein